MYSVVSDYFVPDSANGFCEVVDSGGNPIELPITTPSTSVNGAFDPTITSLQGPGGQVGTVQLGVFKGELVMDNIYQPLSIQTGTASGWVVGTGGFRSAIAYNSTGVRNWVINSSLITLTKSRGSVYELSNLNLLIAAPAQSSSTTLGSVMVINRIAKNSVILNLSVQGDANRAIPDSTESNYYIAIYDATNQGKSSRILRVNTSGQINWIWGAGIVVEPVGLKLLSNGDLLISE
jgi:hypothetical protein